MAITLNNHVFKGHKTLLGSKYVTYGELELPQRSDIFEISSNGFDWGNSSKQAQQLAFSMLYQLSDKEIATESMQKFTQEVVHAFNSRDWVISASEVLVWLEKNSSLFIQKRENTFQAKPTNTQKKSSKKQKKSNIVKDVCRELGITQKNLAEILEVPEGTISSWAVKNEIPRLGKKAIEFYIESTKNRKIVDSYKNFVNLLQAS